MLAQALPQPLYRASLAGQNEGCIGLDKGGKRGFHLREMVIGLRSLKKSRAGDPEFGQYALAASPVIDFEVTTAISVGVLMNDRGRKAY